MTSQLAAPASELVLPAYQSSSLADLTPSIGAHLGVPGYRFDPLGLPASQRYVVVLIDGLGFHLVRRAIREAPYLASLLGDATAITAGVPSTTVTSVTSLGTGLTPGQHGMVGYSSRVPGTGELLNALTWESDLDPRQYQGKPTFFEKARDDGVAVSSVAIERFRGSGLTEAALRGADFVAFQHEHQEERRIELIVAAAARGSRSLVYAYERELDHTGHALGCESPQWLSHLSRIDAMCERLRDALPDDVRLIVTGDHGMVDIPKSGQILAEAEPELMAGVSALAGEGRFRQLYVDRDDVRSVAARWSDRLGDMAWIRTRDEAIDEGWFGTVDDRLRERYGHVLVAMRDCYAVMTAQFPRELELVGMHGSLTPAEMMVPLFCD
jgi:predicted AlkP superfamily pyrophosphatase or phosphodiesterase